jgi:carboxylesterase type B
LKSEHFNESEADNKLILNFEFVRQNAKNLGGDAAKIKIGGESAGGWSIERF